MSLSYENNLNIRLVELLKPCWINYVFLPVVYATGNVSSDSNFMGTMFEQNIKCYRVHILPIVKIHMSFYNVQHLRELLLELLLPETVLLRYCYTPNVSLYKPLKALNNDTVL